MMQKNEKTYGDENSRPVVGEKHLGVPTPTNEKFNSMSVSERKKRKGPAQPFGMLEIIFRVHKLSIYQPGEPEDPRADADWFV